MEHSTSTLTTTATGAAMAGSDITLFIVSCLAAWIVGKCLDELWKRIK